MEGMSLSRRLSLAHNMFGEKKHRYEAAATRLKSFFCSLGTSCARSYGTPSSFQDDKTIISFDNTITSTAPNLPVEKRPVSPLPRHAAPWRHAPRPSRPHAPTWSGRANSRVNTHDHKLQLSLRKHGVRHDGGQSPDTPHVSQARGFAH